MQPEYRLTKNFSVLIETVVVQIKFVLLMALQRNAFFVFKMTKKPTSHCPKWILQKEF